MKKTVGISGLVVLFLVVLSWYFISEPQLSPMECSEEFLCGEGEGNCNFDLDCRGNLICLENGGEVYGYDSEVNVCVQMEELERPLLGENDYCTLDFLCEEGQGDCNNDAYCKGDLVCKKNLGANYGFESWVDICVVEEESG